MSSKGCPTPNKHRMSSEGSNIVKLYPELAKKKKAEEQHPCGAGFIGMRMEH